MAAFACLCLFGLLMTCAIIRSGLLYRKIKNDPELKSTLMNEMYISFEYKINSMGYHTLLTLVAVFLLLHSFFDLPVRLSILIIFYAGIMVTEIYRLILYK